MNKLRWTQRLTIEAGIKSGKTNAQIAREIGVHRATVGREIARNASTRENYSARTADDASWQRQQEATPKRFLVSFNGVSYFQILQKHGRIYTYISRTHLNAQPCHLSNPFGCWDSSYIRLGEHERFMPDDYLRFRLSDSAPKLFTTASDLFGTKPVMGWPAVSLTNKPQAITPTRINTGLRNEIFFKKTKQDFSAPKKKYSALLTHSKKLIKPNATSPLSQARSGFTIAATFKPIVLKPPNERIREGIG